MAKTVATRKLEELYPQYTFEPVSEYMNYNGSVGVYKSTIDTYWVLVYNMADESTVDLDCGKQITYATFVAESIAKFGNAAKVWFS